MDGHIQRSGFGFLRLFSMAEMVFQITSPSSAHLHRPALRAGAVHGSLSLPEHRLVFPANPNDALDRFVFRRDFYRAPVPAAVSGYGNLDPPARDGRVVLVVLTVKKDHPRSMSFS